MYNFIRYVAPFLILVIAIVIPLLVPIRQPIQITIAALVGGIPMWLISNLPYKPNVVIGGLEGEVIWDLWENGLRCFVLGRMRNKSSTGEGDIEEFLLRIFLNDQAQLDVPITKSIEPSIIGFRIKPNGVLPTEVFEFELLGSVPKGIDVTGKPAEIRLIVVGQKMRTYKVKMKEKK